MGGRPYCADDAAGSADAASRKRQTADSRLPELFPPNLDFKTLLAFFKTARYCWRRSGCCPALVGAGACAPCLAFWRSA